MSGAYIIWNMYVFFHLNFSFLSIHHADIVECLLILDIIDLEKEKVGAPVTTRREYRKLKQQRYTQQDKLL